MIVEKLMKLPSRIGFQGCDFELYITVNRDGEGLTMAYVLVDCHRLSKHYNVWVDVRNWSTPFEPFPGLMQDYLFRRVVLFSDNGLLNAIEECRVFLRANNLG